MLLKQLQLHGWHVRCTNAIYASCLQEILHPAADAECAICMEQPRRILFIPCGHLVPAMSVLLECAARPRQCAPYVSELCCLQLHHSCEPIDTT